MKGKIQAAPKEFLRRGLLTGEEKLKGQLRDAAEGGRREDTETDRVQDTARMDARRAAGRLEKLVRGKEKNKGRLGRSRSDTAVPEAHVDAPSPNTQAGPDITPSSAEPVRIKTREAASGVSTVERRPSAAPNQPIVKMEDAYIHRQADNPLGVTAQPEKRGREEFVRARGKKASVREVSPDPYCGRTTPIRGGGEGNTPVRYPAAQTARKQGQPVGNPVSGAVVKNGKPFHTAHPNQKVTRQLIHQRANAAVNASPKTVKTVERTGQAVQQITHAAVQAQRRAVRAADGAMRVVATVGRPVAKAAVSALRGALLAIRAAAAPLAAGGGAVIAVVLVLCLVAALLLSPLGIFFSGEENGGQTMASVVREINLEYDAKIEKLKSNATYDEVSLSGSRAPWPEVLAVYAVKTTSDPLDGQEVVTMTDEKKALLKRVFWDMNVLYSFTSTVPGEGAGISTTTLHITVTAKTVDEMADAYGFNTGQRQQLTELLSDEYRDLWNAILYGIGTGSGEIVAVALSQVGNVGGQPYWSWYGFDHRVDWCAIFVSWCADQCGYIEAGIMPKFAGCVQGSRWFKERGLWQDKSYTPSPGNIIFFDWNDPGGFSGPQDGLPDHVGIVERVENGRVYTVEGNSGDKCYQRSYLVGYYEVYGYGTLCP